jgi:hypothetical protein
VTDQPQTPGERPLTPGDEPPPLNSAGDQPTAVEPVMPATADQPTIVEPGVSAPPEPPAQAASVRTELPPLSPAEPALSGAASAIQQKPEIAVGGAFAGGLVVALILKRLAR